MNLIKNIIEPNRLLLTWMPPERSGHQRKNRVVGELKKDGDNIVLQYCYETEDYKEAKECGFQTYPSFKNEKQIYNKGVLDTFIMRLPPRTRKDFDDFLKSIRINPEAKAKITDFALLGYSEAKLPSDNFSIVHPFDNVLGPCEVLTEIAGSRYYLEEGQMLQIGDRVFLEFEQDNPFDAMAIQIIYQGKKIGYINRIQLPAFHRWLKEVEVAACIERINGTKEKPRVFLFVSVTPK